MKKKKNVPTRTKLTENGAVLQKPGQSVTRLCLTILVSWRKPGDWYS